MIHLWCFLVCLQTYLETPHSFFQALSCACSLSWRVWGDTAWVGRTLVCVDDDSNFVVLREGQPMQLQLLPQQREVLIPDTAPGQVVDIAVRFVSPQIVGRFVSYWKMRSADGSWSFPNNTGLTVQVQVVDFIHTACHQA